MSMTVVEAGRKGGKVHSPDKSKSAVKNGAKGGRPPSDTSRGSNKVKK